MLRLSKRGIKCWQTGWPGLNEGNMSKFQDLGLRLFGGERELCLES